MSLYSLYEKANTKELNPIDSSVNLLQSMPSFADGRYLNKSVFETFNFVDTPYNSMCIHDFSISTLVSTGFKPQTVFCQSNQIDKVIDSANLISKMLDENK